MIARHTTLSVENLLQIGRDTDEEDTVEEDMKENIEPENTQHSTYVGKMSPNSDQNLAKSKRIDSWLLS